MLKHLINKSSLESVELIRPPVVLQNRFASIVEEVLTLQSKQRMSANNIDQLLNSLIAGAFVAE
jgi:type I restriction enzyme S subunit